MRSHVADIGSICQRVTGIGHRTRELFFEALANAEKSSDTQALSLFMTTLNIFKQYLTFRSSSVIKI